MGALAKYIIRRLLFVIPVFFAASILTYVIGTAAGDPIQIIRRGNPAIRPEVIQNLIKLYNFDKPLYVQYVLWLANFFTGNLGDSVQGGSVNIRVQSAFWPTIELQAYAHALALLIAVPVGIFSARRQYSKADIAITSTAILGVSMPTFWLGIILIIVFASWLQWLPSGGYSGVIFLWWGNPVMDRIAHLVMPVLVLTYVQLALYVRLIRANMLEVIRQDFVTALRASGLSERNVIYRHALKNAITPVVTFVGLTAGTVLAGAPLTETVFSWPGLGFTFVDAAQNLDIPLVLSVTMLIAVMVTAANLFTDVAYGILDARVRLE